MERLYAVTQYHYVVGTRNHHQGCVFFYSNQNGVVTRARFNTSEGKQTSGGGGEGRVSPSTRANRDGLTNEKRFFTFFLVEYVFDGSKVCDGSKEFAKERIN